MRVEGALPEVTEGATHCELVRNLDNIPRAHLLQVHSIINGLSSDDSLLGIKNTGLRLVELGRLLLRRVGARAHHHSSQGLSGKSQWMPRTGT